MKETTLSRITAPSTEVTSYASPVGEKTGPMAQAFKRAAVDHHHIILRNAPMNSMSNGAGRTARIWRTG